MAPEDALTERVTPAEFGSWERDEGIGSRALAVVTRLLVRPYRPTKTPSRKVAIVVPLSGRPELLPEEAQSMRHLTHFLGHYPMYLVAPAGTGIRRGGFETLELPRKFFGSAAAHNRLLLWPSFYRAFEDYEYVLMYHLDSLVLRDELAHWCEVGLDYIGAPWLPCPDTPWVKEPRVGNGGFTLMKIESVLQVLHNRYRQKPDTFWSDMLTRNGSHLGPVFRVLETLQRVFPTSSIVGRPLAHWRVSENPRGRNNDQFWSYHAARYLPAFRIGTVEEGLQFAFEAAPRTCFELNQRRLPFGCHAWAKYDRAFWEPHLLPSDDNQYIESGSDAVLRDPASKERDTRSTATRAASA